MRLPLAATAFALLCMASSGPAAARGWTTDTDEGRAVLAYVEEDEVHLVMTCGEGGMVTLSAQLFSTGPSDAQIAAATNSPVQPYVVKGGAELSSGGLKRTFRAGMTVNQEAAVWVADVTLSATDPLLAAFARSGQLTFASTGDTEIYRMGPKTRPLLTRFLAACK